MMPPIFPPLIVEASSLTAAAGAVLAQERARVDAAVVAAAAIPPLVQAATDAQAGAVAAAGQSATAATAAQQAASTAATQAAALAAPAAADAVRAEVAADADRAEAAAGDVDATKVKLDTLGDSTRDLDDSGIPLRVFRDNRAIDVLLTGEGPDGDAGLDFMPSQRLASRLGVPDEAQRMEVGETTLIRYRDGYRAIVMLDGEDGDAGVDFIPSQRLAGRLGAATAPDGGWSAAMVDGALHFTGRAGAGLTDRFRLDGTIWRPTAREAVLLMPYGQSNSGITALGETPIWTAPPTPWHALTFNDYISGRGGVRGLLGQGPTSAPTDLIPATEVNSIQSIGLATASRLVEISDGLPPVTILRAEAQGGQPFVGLTPGTGIWKDSTGAFSPAFNNLVASAGTAIALATAEAYSVPEIVITFDHQEADQAATRAAYLANWIAFKADAEAALAPLNKPVRWLVTQAAGHLANNAWPVRMAIHDATLPANGGANVTMTLPRYWLPLGQAVGGGVDPIHHSYEARVLQGEVLAFVLRELGAGRPWRCAYPSAVTVSGNSIVADFDSLLPLILDPAPPHPVLLNHGFALDGTAATITAVAQTGPRQITLTTSASAAGARLRYAYRASGASLVNYALGTGSLRETWGEQSRWLRGRALHRWALGFEWQM